MSRILVSGLVNFETTVRVPGFPLAYTPVQFPFYGVNHSISGVGFNITKALTTLGDQVHFLTLLGNDATGDLSRAELARLGIAQHWVVNALDRTAQSVILYDPSGARMIFTDLKDNQERDYPSDLFNQALPGCDLAVLTNINYSRPFLAWARQLGVPIATDVHTLSDLDDPYNLDFMANAEILFMSHENLPLAPQDWIRRVWEQFTAGIVVIGMGANGALLGMRDERSLHHVPAVHPRPVVSTIGAGDALFSAFIHFYLASRDPYQALHKAVFYAAYKIGSAGAADDLLNETTFNQEYARYFNNG